MGRRRYLELPAVLLRAARPAEEPDRSAASHVAPLHERGGGKRRAPVALRHERQTHGGDFDLRLLHREGQLQLRERPVRPTMREGRLHRNLLRPGRAFQGERAGGAHRRVPFLGQKGRGGVRIQRHQRGDPRQAWPEPVPARRLRGDGGRELGSRQVRREGRSQPGVHAPDGSPLSQAGVAGARRRARHELHRHRQDLPHRSRRGRKPRGGGTLRRLCRRLHHED